MGAPLDLLVAAQRGDVGEDIEHLADLGWLVPVWAIWEKVSKGAWFRNQGMSGSDAARSERHLELLNIYIRSSAEDAHDWNGVQLSEELGSLIREIKSKISDGEAGFLRLYEEIYQEVTPYMFTRLEPISLTLINMADASLDILIELETLPPR